MLPGILLILYLILFSALGIAPLDRAVWWAENIPTFFIVLGLTLSYRRFSFSNAAYLWMSVFIVLHTIGGHYTFEKVPFGIITDLVGAERNHYDRMAHFSVGFYAFALGELVERIGAIRHKVVLAVFMVGTIFAVASLYEIIEWLYAVSAAPEQGVAFLGSQGDIWDAQKDMLADGLGAVVATIVYFITRHTKMMKDHSYAHTLVPLICFSLLSFYSPLLLACRAETGGASLSALDTRVSIGPFPYDLTVEALQTVTTIVKNNANLYTVQLDNGVPWEEALRGREFKHSLLDQWQRHKASIAPHHQVYLAIAPLKEDRISWAASHSGQEAPSWAREEGQLREELKQAYTKYVLRAIEYFHPQFLNIGVEAGDMASKRPEKWPLMEALFSYTATAVRAKYPSIKIGISFGLPLLMNEGVLERAMPLITQSDYIGISFYPYMSDFYVKLGANPLPAPPVQWRAPLEWLRESVNKPIAVCETAYSSETVKVPLYDLTLQGSAALQSEYVEDLAAIARRDKYLFTAFFLAVDYDALMQKLHPGDETTNLWKRTGFFETTLAEKPAWSVYKRAWLRQKTIKPTITTTPAKAKPLGEKTFRTKL